ncbi:hypothetical protein [Pendulispora albinea]|uniref:Uncharacterized protein n=1 Tax=Pendulispora albinea TaxID=2741071 RepID=A0ABZ2LR17_9BACT
MRRSIGHRKKAVFVVLTAALFGLGSLTALGSSGCKKETRWDQAAATTTSEARAAAREEAGLPPAPEVKQTKGAAFNTLFPGDGTDGYKRVFTQEKEGFAEAKLQKDGKDVATLSLSDSVNDDQAKGKFEKATEKVDAYPLITVGKNQSALLVNGRYQVKVSSQTLDATARKSLLSKFDLGGIARL